jgi:hypothetical protein
MNPTAVFLGWQLNGKGEKAFPLFNIIGAHEYSGSTVTDETLRRFGIPVPEFK